MNNSIPSILICILFSIIFSFSSVQARICRVDELRLKQLQTQADLYTPYPIMTKATMVTSLFPLVPRLDQSSSESNTFWLLNMIGLSGWFYNGFRIVTWDDCDMSAAQNQYYRARLTDLVKYHEDSRGVFWQHYTWNAGWMLAILATTKYDERKVAAIIALGAPWGFSLTKKWSAFASQSELELSLVPLPERSFLNLSFRF